MASARCSPPRILPRFLSEHAADKVLFCILVGADSPHELKVRVLAEDIYLTRIHDEVFTLNMLEIYIRNFAQETA